ncbi:MAG: M56 family metallopeptidase [Planctomycetia bacterium]|nr:M56 family metallopeptidase [Planctomycetia bacterium]
MNASVEMLNAWAAGWSATLLAVVWQSTILAAAVGLVAALLRRASPTVRYWLWQIVAIKILLAPLWTLAVPLPWFVESPPPAPKITVAEEVRIAAAALEAETVQMLDELAPASHGAAPGAIAGHGKPVPEVPREAAALTPLSWRAWLMIAWAAIVAGEILLIVWQRARLSRLLRDARPAESELEKLVATAASRIGLARRPRVLLTPAECSPFVCGVWRPAVVLPRSLAALAVGGELEPVLVHELAHIKRRDLVWGWIPLAARALYFFHPVVHWVAFRVRLEAELACDGWAMATSGQGPGAYANLLVRVVSRLSEPAMLRAGSAAAARLDGHERLAAEESSLHPPPDAQTE